MVDITGKTTVTSVTIEMSLEEAQHLMALLKSLFVSRYPALGKNVRADLLDQLSALVGNWQYEVLYGEIKLIEV